MVGRVIDVEDRAVNVHDLIISVECYNGISDWVVVHATLLDKRVDHGDVVEQFVDGGRNLVELGDGRVSLPVHEYDFLEVFYFSQGVVYEWQEWLADRGIDKKELAQGSGG